MGIRLVGHCSRNRQGAWQYLALCISQIGGSWGSGEVPRPRRRVLAEPRYHFISWHQETPLGTVKSRKKKLAVPTGEKTVSTTWKTSGCKQLLEMIGVREKRHRSDPTASRASTSLSKFGRIRAARNTIKHEADPQKAAGTYTCLHLFEIMYRGKLKRLYNNLGEIQLDAWNALADLI